MIAETVLWHARRGTELARCVVVSGCAGVEVQIVEEGAITRRERHADRSTAYERARELRARFEEAGYLVADGARGAQPGRGA